MVFVDVVIPTYKPDKSLFTLIDALETQSLRPARIILMNTEEKYLNSLLYGSRILKKYGNIDIHNISKREFNHGRTRNEGAARGKGDVILFMTQDAVPCDNHLIENLLKPMVDKDVCVSYARQLPAADCNPIETFSRQFNYPAQSRVKGAADLPTLGIKTYFCSDVCAAYKRQAFEELGGFVRYTIFNEDMLFAAKAVKAGKKIAYAADAQVIHSHNYTGAQQFKRNFDLGVSQADHPEVFDGIKSEGEGIKMVKQTALYLIKQKKAHLIPYLIYYSGCKYLGYRKGRKYKNLSHKQILRYTLSPDYWDRYWDKKLVPENVYAGYGKNEEGL